MTIPRSAQGQGTAAPGPKEARDIPTRVFSRVKVAAGGAVGRKTSPILAPHSPRRLVHSPIPPVPESPSDEFVLLRCDAAPAPTAQDRFLPAVPASAHRGDHLFDCSC